jgi:hypothetical protein
MASALCALSVSAQPGALAFVQSELGQDTILDNIENRVPRRFRQVGTTSVTLRLDLGAGMDAAFKPRTRSHPRGFLAEIAAYRVARLLGMDNVPPVVGRRIPRPLLEERLETEHPEDWEPIRQEILWDAPGIVRGAAVYWVPSMSRTELDGYPGLEAASAWLRVDTEIPERSQELARDLSTMLAFDYLIGNWDRFSGGNVSTDQEERRLFVRDHNLAFQVPLPDARYARLRGDLERAQRFSRSFVVAVRAMNERTLRAALAEDPLFEDGPILAPGQIDGVLARRRAFLSYVGALIAVHGADAVLAFP